MNGPRIDVTVKPGVVTLELLIGPLALSLSFKPRDADALAGALQRGAIEANAPKLALVTPAPLPAANT